MIATFINAAAVVIGTLIGVILHHRVSGRYRDSVLIGAGIITLIIGISMALKVDRVVYLALSVILGGIAGTWLDIEGRILGLGAWLEGLVARKPSGQAGQTLVPQDDGAPTGKTGQNFARGFMEASVLFCAGSMTILGSFQAAGGDFGLLLTKSVLDGFMAVILAATLGWGVGFSALTVLAYQGILTMLSGFVQSLVDPLMQRGISAVGGAMVLMIGLGLLGIKKIPVGNFLPAMVLVVVFSALDPWLPVVLHF